MAGQGHIRGTRALGRSLRAGRSSLGPGVRSVAASGSSTGIETSRRSTPSTPTLPERPTRSTYRLLVMRGLAPDEAANLTAFMSGIPVGEASWTLVQVNRLLFLRELQRSGRFGARDGIATS
jgi:hypothetical protein